MDKFIFDSLPGAGPQLTRRLLVGFGIDRDRYIDPKEMQMYSAVAPVIEHSGRNPGLTVVTVARHYNAKPLSSGGQSIRYSFWAKAYYQQQIAKGKPHNAAIRSLAFKGIRIVFSYWEDRKP